jgi:hypothetical protein
MIRTAGILTFVFSFIALWIAFVLAGGDQPDVDWPVSWLHPGAASLILMVLLFWAGYTAASDQKTRKYMNSSQKSVRVPTVIAALVVVGALLALVYSMRALLWGGPAWLRWTIVGMFTTAVLLGSGRALGCAGLGALCWVALGFYVGIGRESIGRMDLIFVGLMVGTTVGAVAGTLWNAFRRGGRGGKSNGWR